MFMSIARVIALALSAATTQVAVWTALECSIAIIITCFPTLRGLLRSLESQKSSGKSSQGIGHLNIRSHRQDLLRDKCTKFPITEGETGEHDAKLVLVSSKEVILRKVDFETVGQISQSTEAKIESGDAIGGGIRI